MFREGKLDKTLRAIKRLIPEPLFQLGAKIYHPLLSWSGALRYGFPSRKLVVIGVTGTKGKSTTVFLISRILEHAGHPVAAIGSLGYKIKDREWPNLLKMTMPGRWKIQKFLREAADAGCTHVVMECPSEGLAQGRHRAIRFASVVFLNIHPEHLEAHGGWENYVAAKQILFRACRELHVINRDDPSADKFLHFPSLRRVTFGVGHGDMRATDLVVTPHEVVFSVEGTRVNLKLGGAFNVSNALAAVAVADAHGVPPAVSAEALAQVTEVPGRMQWLQTEPFGVVVDYAHTPESLEFVYWALKPQALGRSPTGEAKRLICVLGAAGGGRDTWKRPKFGEIAGRLCDRIYLTNEDPYDENPDQIVSEIRSGIANNESRISVQMDRAKAIAEALTEAKEGDIVVITGKGSETSMALAGGKKVPWSDAQTVNEILQRRR